MRTVPRYDFETTDEGALFSRKVAPQPTPHDPITGDSHALTGMRVIIARPTTWLFDMRACSEPYLTSDHGWVIDIVDEADWYLHHDDPQGFPPILISTRPVNEVWVE